MSVNNADNSSGDSNSGPSAADIISYIGIPLAVLGVIPIFYTFLNSIITAWNIKRRLRRNAVQAVSTRSSWLSGIVEVEFPRYSIAVPDRDDPDYWSLNPHPSRLKGGSWTIFNWNRLAVGKKSYRLSFSVDIQEPQAEADFDELLNFLMDRGAVPDAKGFRLLNMAGLWTPANTSLLLSPDQRDSVLRVTFPDDSDGILSLALQWQANWAEGSGDGLPPHWMRLSDHRPSKRLAMNTASEVVKEGQAVEEITEEKPAAEGAADEKSKEVIASITKEAEEEAGSPAGDEKKIPSASAEAVGASGSDSDRPPKYEGSATGDDAGEAQNPYPRSVIIHLNMRSGMPIIDDMQLKLPLSGAESRLKSNSILTSGLTSTWLAVFAAALGTMTGAAIWTIHMPGSFAELARRDVLPCGVLVMLGVLDEADSPSWETKYDPNEWAQEEHRRHMLRFQAMNREQRMSPADQMRERKVREEREFHEFVQMNQDRQRRKEERAKQRQREALESSKVSTEVAVKAALRRLSRADVGDDTAASTSRAVVAAAAAASSSSAANSTNGEELPCIEPWDDMQTAAETVLFTMITEEAVGREVCTILERWKIWNTRGGLNVEDLSFLEANDAWRWLCYAIIMMALLKAEGTRKESTLAQDLQECIKTWKRVRLG